MESYKMKLLLFLLIPFPLFSQNFEECKKFRNGKFTLPLAEKTAGYEIRQDGIQTSYVREGVIQYVWGVKWIDECHYNLTMLKSNDTTEIFVIGDIIEVEINSFKNNCYGYKATLKLQPHNKFLEKHRKEFYDMICKEDEM
jgi:hypothetical protein